MAGREAFEAARIESGFPLFGLDFDERNFPQEVGRDRQAISFTKGCYAGQEIVARTENLGKSRRRLMRYEADHAGLSVGDTLSSADRAIGEIVNIEGCELLAVTPLEDHGTELRCGDTIVRPIRLPYEIGVARTGS